MVYRVINGSTWYECCATVKSSQGVHGRPVFDLSTIAQTYQGRVVLIHKEEEADVKSPTQLLSQCILKDASLTLRVERGEQCEALASKLVALLERSDV